MDVVENRETENLALMAVLLAGISAVLLTWTGGYVTYARSNSNPLIVYSCMAVSVLLFAASCFAFRVAERREECAREKKD